MMRGRGAMASCLYVAPSERRFRANAERPAGVSGMPELSRCPTFELAKVRHKVRHEVCLVLGISDALLWAAREAGVQISRESNKQGSK